MDVLVVGGGPAGLAAAIAARAAGFSVTLAERRTPPVDKACGEGIMPGGVEVLGRLGVRLPPERVFPFSGIRYVEGEIDAIGRFAGTPGLGVRRIVLHEAMTRRAEETGVRLLWGASIDEVDPGEARWVIAADGQRSRLRRDLGLDTPARRHRFGVRRHYRIEPWSEFVEVHWSTGCEIYVTPVAGDEVCVAALASDQGLRLDAAISMFPALARRLAGAPPAGSDLGSGILFRTARAVTSGRAALIGDAAGSLDAITGDGVTLALHQSEALARALARGDLASYERDYRRIMRLPVGMTSMILAVKGRPALRRLSLRALQALPALFEGLVALHTRRVVLGP